MGPLRRTFFLSVATGLGAGYFPLFPGTAGSAAAIPLSLGLNRLSGISMPLAALCLLAFIAAAWWFCHKAEEILQEKDSKRIVIDEMAGFLLANFVFPAGLKTTAAAFVLFRLFDIIKPFPAGRAERLRGGAGIIADDLIAGLYAFLFLRLLLSWTLL
jgi:phosphatidylglycerophosphatase A